MKIAFKPQNFSISTLVIIKQANMIIREYLQDNLKLTLRQLYYQFVARDIIKNKQSEYKRLGGIINDARICGMIDWDAIEDRGRNLRTIASWDSPAEIIDSCASSFKLDLWIDQPRRLEVWIEKQALEGVVERVCVKNRVPFFSCKGYVSQSEMFDAGYHRFQRYKQRCQPPLILHFGDHDPSGIDMTRDITDRIHMFMGEPFEIRRLALNMDQIQQFNPPPNPAKVTDSRFSGYQALHGDDSWELDALEPRLLVELIDKEIVSVRDNEKWDVMVKREQKQKAYLEMMSENYDGIIEYLEKIEE